MAEEQVAIGVDTHKYFHVAVALSVQGVRLGELTVAADPGGYEQLLDWARSLGTPWCFGVEGLRLLRPGPGLLPAPPRPARRGGRTPRSTRSARARQE
jgi:hypothetical protein